MIPLDPTIFGPFESGRLTQVLLYLCIIERHYAMSGNRRNFYHQLRLILKKLVHSTVNERS